MNDEFEILFGFVDRPIEEARDSINRKRRDGPGGDDPQRRAFGGVIMPEIGLRSPRFDRQPSAYADEDDEQVGFEIRASDDGQRHEAEDAEQQPVHVTPPRARPVHVFEVFLREGPPDVHDEEDREQESAEEDG